VSTSDDAPFLRTTPAADGDVAPEAWPIRLARWAAIGTVVAAAVAALVHLKRQTPATPVLAVERAEFIAVSGPVPPSADAANWRPVALTDDWWRTRPETAEGWYRVDLDLRVAPDRPARGRGGRDAEDHAVTPSHRMARRHGRRGG